MAPATIRAARLSGAGEVAHLTTQLGYGLTEADAADRLSRLLLRDDQQFFVADVDGRAVGWVHVVFAEYVDAEAFVVIGALVEDCSAGKRKEHGVIRRDGAFDEQVHPY